MNPKHAKGFTLVEVMVALFVVAIVATPLLQMFVTTSYANKDAQVMDLANVIAVQQAEKFKADPAGYRSSNEDTSYYFYKGDGTPINPTSVYHDLTVIPDGAVIMVKSDLPEPTVTSSNDAAGYYPDFAGTIDLSLYPTDLDVNIKKENYTDETGKTYNYIIGVEPAGSAFVSLQGQDTSKEKNNLMPIRVDYKGNPTTINVKNDSDLEAEFYIFNTNNGIGVTFNTLQGSSNVAYVPTISKSFDKEYDLTLTVKRLNKGDWVKMLTYSANRHLYY